MKTLKELYQEHEGKVSDKWEIYLNEYDRIFSSYRENKINLLEIGVQNGGSLEIWEKYYPHANLLVGCDINDDCARLEYNSEIIKIVVGDANLDNTENKIRNISNQFDIIIDDGSHTSEDIARTFSRYFPYLKDGGVFVAEDLHCSYWESYGGGLYDLTSSISFFKQLVDVINYEHWGLNKGISEVISVFNSKYGLSLSLSDLEEIHSVEFVNSFCVIRKKTVGQNRLGRRVIVGKEELVMPVLENFNGNYGQPFFQDENNENSIHPLLRIEQREKAINELCRKSSFLEDKVSQLESHVSSRETEIELHKEKIAILESNVSSLLSSKSWRLTKPLRALRNTGSKPNRLIVFSKTAVKLGGGIRPTCSKALNLWRSEGFNGLLRGFRYVTSVGADPHAVSRNDYVEWISRYDRVDVEKVLQRNRQLINKPLISVIMPVYNPDLDWLEEAVESIINQVYVKWELCIADDKSTDNKVKDYLNKLQTRDSRVKVFFRKENGHISEASNSALGLAEGEWVALVDQDDLLSPDALLSVAEAINRCPNGKLYYSDEDKIDENGNRFGPYFKSDWNKYLFYSHNLITHLGVYSKETVDKIGGFRTGVEGAQDYDLALRFIEQISEDQIVHIPKILYHWRAHSKSTASGINAKNYAIDAGQTAIESHFLRTGISANVLPERNGYRVNYSLPNPLPKVSIIIPTRNGLNYLKTCIESVLKKTDYENKEIIVVDNDSDDPLCLEYLDQISSHYEEVSVLRDMRPFNFSSLNNLAVKKASGDVLVLMNNDVEAIEKDWLKEMVSLACQDDVGAVGAKLLYPNNTIQHAGVVMGLGGAAGHVHQFLNDKDFGYASRLSLINQYSAVTAACLAVKKSLYDEVGGLDEDEFAVAYNDVDFCLKLCEKGYKNVYTPYAVLYHHESVTRGYEDTPEKKVRFETEKSNLIRKWEKYISHDPCYNPNLTADYSDFSLAWPPRVEL